MAQQVSADATIGGPPQYIRRDVVVRRQKSEDGVPNSNIELHLIQIWVEYAVALRAEKREQKWMME